MSNINEGRIQPRHKPSDTAEENIAYGKVGIGFLMVQLDQLGVFEQRDFHFRRGGINNQFFFHATSALNGH
ncbi:MAG: hypothetical protein IPJ40_15690 [Saprospirales bacterium]|nr:hypothetical protein [Saprospirales bacterium]